MRGMQAANFFSRQLCNVLALVRDGKADQDGTALVHSVNVHLRRDKKKNPNPAIWHG